MRPLNPHSIGRGFSPQPAPNRAGGRDAPQVARAPRRDPAPSRLAYRLHRLWLTPLYRKITRVGVPAFLVALVAGIWLSDDDRRASLTAGLTGMVEKVQNRDEFMVHMMKIEGASPVVDAGLRAMLPVKLPASSFDIDLEALREQVLRLDAVETVELRIKPGGILSAVVTERQPAILWRHARGVEILDKTGHRVASVTGREVRADLPLIAGEGADRAVPEALRLLDAAGPILPRLRGLERIGERRWDVVLDEGQRIMLPETHTVQALDRAIALDKAQDMLARDIGVVDLRDASRPTVRLGLNAQNTIRVARGMEAIQTETPADADIGDDN